MKRTRLKQRKKALARTLRVDGSLTRMAPPTSERLRWRGRRQPIGASRAVAFAIAVAFAAGAIAMIQFDRSVLAIVECSSFNTQEATIFNKPQPPIPADGGSLFVAPATTTTRTTTTTTSSSLSTTATTATHPHNINESNDNDSSMLRNPLGHLRHWKRESFDNTTVIDENALGSLYIFDPPADARNHLPAPQAQVSSGAGTTKLDGGAAVDLQSGVAAPPQLQGLAKQQLDAFTLAQEANRAANILNAELCRNFSIGLQYETGGVFTSPDYPNPYPLNLICTRLIEAPIGHYIVLEFRDQFNIEEAGTDCDSDKIEIRDGRYGYSKVLARYCGTKFPPEVRSTNEAMWLRFISDSSITHNGFKAVYRFEKQKNIKPNPPFECRFNVTAMSSFPVSGNNTENRTGIHSGVIRNTDVQSQLLAYSKEFNVSLECIWNITVMPGWKIYLTFSNYELNKPNDCDSNFIEIYEENLTEENQTVKFCGTRTEPQQSKSNIFNIRHHALPSASGSRFEIIYTAFRDKGVEGCDAREFDCDDGTCIHESLKCDGQVNCKYRYDEASDPGPCQSGDPEGTFFETEHMVIILIVFLTLVGGMCASIIVSCWGKIQERRRRKLEYHMRKSREASMEGQLNKAGQIIYGPNDARPSGQGAATSVKKRHLAAPIMPAENAIQQQINSKYALENQANGSRAYLGQDPSLQQLPHGVQYQHQQQKMMAMDGGNYGIYGQQQAAGGGSQDDKQMSINKSLQNIQQSMLTSLASQNAQQQQQQPQQVGDLSQLQQQQSVPDISYNNQFKMQSVVNDGGQLMPAGLLSANEALVQEAQHLHQQQMLNISLTRNHLNQQQQHQQKLSNTNNPIYQQQQQHQLDNNSTSNGNSNSNTTTNNNNMSVNQYSRYLRHQQNVGGAPLDNIPGGGILNQPASAQTMPISLAKYNTMIHAQLGAQQLHQQQQQTGEPSQLLNYDTSTGSQFATAAAYNPQRALTLSTMHQPLLNIINNSNQQQQRNLQAIYGIHPQSLSAANNNNLSSSVTCCNLSADCMDETPLIGDLLQRASQQQQQRVQFPQNNRIYELRSTTLDPRSPNASIPRSISAHQLSRAQLRQSQNQQRQQQAQHQAQQQQQQHQQQQQQRQQQQLPYKSISDAGHANRHQPPNHSLSYPHACTGSHLDSQQRGGQQSPALPPPPPPPNLMQARSQTACGSLPVSQIHQTDSRRAAFKVSRLDQSQLTGDTMQDSDMLMANMPLGSMQFDEPSTESDGTFGALMNPLGKQHLRQAPQGAAGVAIQAPQALYLTQGIKAAAGARMMQPQRILSHLSDCNLIRRERSLAMNARPSDVQQQQQQQLQSLICNCGALDRANSQLRQQQLQQAASSSHEFDDSDDVACMVQPGNLASLDIGTMMNTIGRQQQQHQQLQQHSGLALQQQQYARFRQQSSELTGEDDDEDDEEMGGYNVDQDDEPSSDALVQGSSGEQHASKVIGYRTRPVVRNEELRDAPGRHLSGSHTSISCQSCTCGSQLRLDQAGAEDESSEATKSNGDDAQDNNNNNTIKNNEVMIDNVAKVQEKTPRKDARAGGGQVASREKGSRAEMTASASLAGSTNNE